MAVAEFASRSSSFFWAKRGDASARHNARVTNLLFKVLSFQNEKLIASRSSEMVFFWPVEWTSFQTSVLYTDSVAWCDLNICWGLRGKVSAPRQAAGMM